MMIKILNKIFCLRRYEHENQVLVYLAGTLGEKTRSRVVRKLICDALGLGPDLLKDDLNSFREASRQVAAVGRNINQIARAVNSGQAQGLVLDSQFLQGVAGQIKAQEKELYVIIHRSRNRWVRHGA
jgi:hypothetical protein